MYEVCNKPIGQVAALQAWVDSLDGKSTLSRQQREKRVMRDWNQSRALASDVGGIKLGQTPLFLPTKTIFKKERKVFQFKVSKHWK